MNAIEVTARFSADGAIEPLAFLWQNQIQRVEAVGRRWEAADGLHFLILTLSGRAFEICYHPNDLRWYLVKVQPEAKAG